MSPLPPQPPGQGQPPPPGQPAAPEQTPPKPVEQPIIVGSKAGAPPWMLSEGRDAGELGKKWTEEFNNGYQP